MSRFSSIHTLVLLFLGIATFFSLTVRAENNAFCGCQLGTNYPSVYIVAPNITTTDNCWSYCYNARNPNPVVAGRTNYRHSMFRASDSTCICTDKYPAEQYQDNGLPGACVANSDWDNRIVQTTFIKYPDCYATTPAGITMNNVAGPDTCSVNCATSINFIFYMDPNSGLYQCGCGTVGTFPAKTSTCGPSTYFIYYHTRAQASQGLSRRRRADAIAEKNKPKKLCRDGFSACRVNTFSDDFECLDTMSDIDSCGGCLYGQVEDPNAPNLDAVAGSDCYSRGTAMGGATCNKGKCVTTKCSRSHELYNGQCVLTRRKK